MISPDKEETKLVVVVVVVVVSFKRVHYRAVFQLSTTPGNPGNLLEIY